MLLADLLSMGHEPLA